MTRSSEHLLAETVAELDRLDVSVWATVGESLHALRAVGRECGTGRIRLAARTRKDRARAAGLTRPPKVIRDRATGSGRRTPVEPIASLVDARLDGALCAGRFPLFDSDVDGESATERAERLAVATRFCDRCPVREACELAAAELGGEACGVWAGRAR